MRLGPERANHVGSCDFVHERMQDDRPPRSSSVADQLSRQRLEVQGERRTRSELMLEALSGRFLRRGVPEDVRSDNGPELAATAAREGVERVGAAALFGEPGSPRQKGRERSLSANLRDELREREVSAPWPGPRTSPGSGDRRTPGRDLASSLDPWPRAPRGDPPGPPRIRDARLAG